MKNPLSFGKNNGVTMKLGVLKEPEAETRVAIVPTSVKKLLKAGFEVVVESGAGVAANYSDSDYCCWDCDSDSDRYYFWAVPSY